MIPPVITYFDVHLNDQAIDVGIIEFIINDLLKNSSRSRSGMNNLTSNIKKITEKMFNVWCQECFCFRVGLHH